MKKPHPLVGLQITCIRNMTRDEKEYEGWDKFQHGVVIIELSDGTRVYPTGHSSGRKPGSFIVRTKHGQELGRVPE